MRGWRGFWRAGEEACDVWGEGTGGEGTGGKREGFFFYLDVVMG